MKHERKTKFKCPKGRPCKSTRKIKCTKPCRTQRGGALLHFELQGDDEPINGKHYEAIQSDDNVPPKWIYHGRVKVVSQLQSEICRENERGGQAPLLFVADGHGVFMQFNDGTTVSIYDGSFVNNNKMGHGKMTYPDGSVYTGNWVNDVISGRGTMKYADKAVYTGNWENGMFSGRGTMKYADDAVYTGSWDLNVKSGLGSMTYADGSKYKGQWQNDLKSGKGRMDYPDKNVYFGDWAEDYPNGKGKFTFNDSNKKEYNGDFEDGYMHGKGIMLMTNGDQYTGEFADGYMDGKGIMIDLNGRIIHDGYWKNDEPVDVALFGRRSHSYKIRERSRSPA
jgi:hypothetical protein